MLQIFCVLFFQLFPRFFRAFLVHIYFPGLFHPSIVMYLVSTHIWIFGIISKKKFPGVFFRENGRIFWIAGFLFQVYWIRNFAGFWDIATSIFDLKWPLVTLKFYLWCWKSIGMWSVLMYKCMPKENGLRPKLRPIERAIEKWNNNNDNSNNNIIGIQASITI
jgi:hypothetical protein